jgi:hypothetical protein
MNPCDKGTNTIIPRPMPEEAMPLAVPLLFSNQCGMMAVYVARETNVTPIPAMRPK